MELLMEGDESLRVFLRHMEVVRGLVGPSFQESSLSGSSVQVKKSYAKQPLSARIARCASTARSRMRSRIPGSSVMVMMNLHISRSVNRC
nr:hypothetical protein [Acidiphilium multivorum]